MKTKEESHFPSLFFQYIEIPSKIESLRADRYIGVQERQFRMTGLYKKGVQKGVMEMKRMFNLPFEFLQDGNWREKMNTGP